MGNTLFRAALRPIKNFNIENRARRLIEKDKPSVAPRYEADRSNALSSDKDGLREKIIAKSNALDERLRRVKIISEGINPELKSAQSNLPQLRNPPDYDMYGFGNPKIVPIGKITLAQTLQLLTKHNNNPKEYQATHVAKDYNIALRDAELILEYYMPLTVVEKTKGSDLNLLPNEPKKQVTDH